MQDGQCVLKYVQGAQETFATLLPYPCHATEIFSKKVMYTGLHETREALAEHSALVNMLVVHGFPGRRKHVHVHVRVWMEPT